MLSKTLKAFALASVVAGTTAATAYAYPHTYRCQVGAVVLGRSI